MGDDIRPQEVYSAMWAIQQEPREIISPASTKYRACGITLINYIVELEEKLKKATDNDQQ